MVEQKKPRETHIMTRGEYLNLGKSYMATLHPFEKKPAQGKWL